MVSAAPAESEPPPHAVSVRTLCEFAARRGDLDHRSTPAPTAQQGIAGHAAVAARRGPGYRAEWPLAGRCGTLALRGRADGYDAERGRVEEIKTHRGDLARVPEAQRVLHRAQLMVYGALLCRAEGRAAVTLALVYFDIDRGTETVFEDTHDAAVLWAFLETLCARHADWAAREAAHRAARDEALARLRFPHGAFRAGQRRLAEAAYRAARDGKVLLAEAPTGIGKTIGTLFPLLKACPTQRLDKVYFLSAKRAGRPLAFAAIDTLAADGRALPLRVVEWVSRDDACLHPGSPCHGDACPLARGFYDRLPAARDEAVAEPRLDGAALAAIAARHALCPYYLGQEMARWADVVVADYSPYFDDAAALHAYARVHEWRVGVLVDEAHHLVERGRAMYSARLAPAAIERARRTAPAALKRPLGGLKRAIAAAAAACADRPAEAETEVPARFAAALERAVSAMTARFVDTLPAPGEAWIEVYFDALHFTRLLERFGTHSSFEFEATAAGPAPRLVNLLPGPFLAPRFAAARTTTLFSATLTPAAYYRDMLGLPADATEIAVESPFGAEQLTVRVAAHISTRQPHRDAAVAPIVELLSRQFDELPGNYLAFFSSFGFLEPVHAAFAAARPDVPAWAQQRAMDAAARRAFLDRFVEGGRGIGFAVLGGSFGEGIELPGSRLIGAFIATLGLPPFDAANERLRTRLERAFGRGYDYAYLYPGLRKVVQAAGRVIRSRTDRGIVVLIDDRFLAPAVRRLLPAWWPEPRPIALARR